MSISNDIEWKDYKRTLARTLASFVPFPLDEDEAEVGSVGVGRETFHSPNADQMAVVCRAAKAIREVAERFSETARQSYQFSTLCSCMCDDVPSIAASTRSASPSLLPKSKYRRTLSGAAESSPYAIIAATPCSSRRYASFSPGTKLAAPFDEPTVSIDMTCE